MTHYCFITESSEFGVIPIKTSLSMHSLAFHHAFLSGKDRAGLQLVCLGLGMVVGRGHAWECNVLCVL